MHIAFVVGTFPELSETFIFDQIAGLLDHGHDVTVFGRAPTSTPPMHAVIERYGLLSRARYWQRGFKTPWDVARRTGQLFRRSAGRTAVMMARSLNVQAHGKLAATGKLWAYASKVLEDDRPFDAVLAHFGGNGLIAQRLRDVGVLRGPLVTIFHGHDLSKTIHQQGRAHYQALFERGELMLPVSEYFKRRLIDLGCPEERVRVHRMGVDLSRFEYLPRTASPDANVRLVSVCRLVEKKGLTFGLQAFAAAQARAANLCWDIVGDGPLRGQLEELARSLGVASRVTFHGSRPRERVQEVLRSSHIFVAPSVTSKQGDQEGVPVAIMEAAASGIPVLSTYHSGIPELVRDRESGLLVPEGDVNALAQAMIDLACAPERWSEMGRIGRARVAEAFDGTRLNAQLVRLLEEVAHRSRQPSV